MTITTNNPFTGKDLKNYKQLNKAQVEKQLKDSASAYKTWSGTQVEERINIIKKVAEILEIGKEKYARLMSNEMGKPITEAIAEVEKCATLCNYYSANAADFLKDEIIETEATKSFVRYAPIGTVLAVMPWNYPFWQVFRFAIPTLLAGNTALLKHASNVLGSGDAIQKIFKQAGLPKDVFTHIIVDYKALAQVLAHDSVQAVSLTGSEAAGASMAEIAGKNLKRCVLELGGSNAVIICEDADIDDSVQVAIKARMQNTGQSCIAGKRFLIHEKVYEEFLTKFTAAVGELVLGNPLHRETQVGPMAKKELADELQRQIKKSLKKGAKIIYGGKSVGAYHEPTILINVKPGMEAFDEETFGPVAVFVKIKTVEEGFELAAKSRFGLGLTICTRDTKKALTYCNLVEDGSYFINEKVTSDPRLPFGGTKKSGYGRELSKAGIHEFVNKQTVYVK